MINREEMKSMTQEGLALMGVPGIAYVKRVEVDGTVGYSIHAADGNQLAWSDDRDTAFAAIRQYDMTPVSVH